MTGKMRKLAMSLYWKFSDIVLGLDSKVKTLKLLKFDQPRISAVRLTSK
jgi:hypothetical protein